MIYLYQQPVKERENMAYKEGKTVISVPVTTETNQLLREIALLTGQKSKTQYAGRLLTQAVLIEYKRLRKEKTWSGN